MLAQFKYNLASGLIWEEKNLEGVTQEHKGPLWLFWITVTILKIASILIVQSSLSSSKYPFDCGIFNQNRLSIVAISQF